MQSRDRRRVATSQLRAMGMHSPGMNVPLAFVALGNDNVDDAIFIRPALRYAREWWLATHPTRVRQFDVLDPKELDDCFGAELERYRAGERTDEATASTRPILAALCVSLGPNGSHCLPIEALIRGK